MRLAARAADELSVKVLIETLQSSRPLKAALSSARLRADDTGQAAGGQRTRTAASPSQRGMWAAEQLAGQPMYTLIVTAFLDGPLDEGPARTAPAPPPPSPATLQLPVTQRHLKAEVAYCIGGVICPLLGNRSSRPPHTCIALRRIAADPR